MSDPRDDELEPEMAEGAEHEHDPDAHPARPALSEEIARRWDPRRLLRMVSDRAGAGQRLDPLTRARYERRLGVDLGHVRVYSGEFAQHVTRQHRAEAVTVGGTGMIMMGGTPDRSQATAAGRGLLAHELTHVAQSQRGVYRSAPTERPPLATEHHEAEAHAVESEEMSHAGGPKKPTAEQLEQQQADLLEKVKARVLEMAYEDERVFELRNGEARIRP